MASTFDTVFPEMGQGARSVVEFADQISHLVSRMPLGVTRITNMVSGMDCSVRGAANLCPGMGHGARRAAHGVAWFGIRTAGWGTRSRGRADRSARAVAEAPTARFIPAQGNALGIGSQKTGSPEGAIQNGRPSAERRPGLARPFRAGVSGRATQGVALGWYRARLWRCPRQVNLRLKYFADWSMLFL